MIRRTRSAIKVYWLNAFIFFKLFYSQLALHKGYNASDPTHKSRHYRYWDMANGQHFVTGQNGKKLQKSQLNDI